MATADKEAKENFLSALLRLDAMACYYATVSERLLLFFDNNVLQDIRLRDDVEQPLRGHRFHALLAFLALVEDHYCLDVFACVSPVVLYEASGRGKHTPKQVEEQVRLLMAEVGLATHFTGHSAPKELGEMFKRIRSDEKALRIALDEIKNKSWVRDFAGEKGHGTRIPFSLAEEECPKIQLTYFEPWHVKFLLIHIIEKNMYRENGDKKKARRLMSNPQEKAFNILKSKGDGVEELGDIELLTLCDLSSQTLMRSPDITVEITFDGSLEAALWKRANVQSRTTFVGGNDDAHDGARRFVYMMKQSQRRTEKANKRVMEYSEARVKFFEPLEIYFKKAVD
ncbi:hypothetical protein [Chromobacterium sinusclupearum]|uniref:hypothetical protein n=1 Tax=Chromobacterium sinusclupearum TaxID=2077146 RepID=UPI0011AFA97A|nr:hypothetical protein [Chromobacterium sinusclupearum]